MRPAATGRWIGRWIGSRRAGERSSLEVLLGEIRGAGAGIGDRWLLAAAFGLLLLGTAMVYSATAVTAHRPTAYLERHLVKVALGIGAFLLGRRIDYHRWGRVAPEAYLVGLTMLLLVFVPGLGHSAGEARRWLSVAGVTIQPAEFARLGLVIYLALLLSKPSYRLARIWTGMAPCLVALGLVTVAVLLQPNLSTALALSGITGLMLMAGRIPWRHLVLPVATLGLVAPVVLRSYQSRRVTDWIDYWSGQSNSLGGNYQMEQSILAIGSGGFRGLGLGESRQKWFFLPDAHTDFVFAIVGEELGFLGAIVVIGLLTVILWRAFETARRAPDRFGYLLAAGIGSSVGVYAGINLLVATGVFPTTGLPLPLVSYGGSALLVTLFSLGILENIGVQGATSLPTGQGDDD